MQNPSQPASPNARRNASNSPRRPTSGQRVATAIGAAAYAAADDTAGFRNDRSNRAGRPSPTGQNQVVPQWLVVSLVLSIVLTVIVNVALRVFPHASEWLDSAMRRLADDAQRRNDGAGAGQMHVIF